VQVNLAPAESVTHHAVAYKQDLDPRSLALATAADIVAFASGATVTVEIQIPNWLAQIEETEMETIGTPFMWSMFAVLVIIATAIDLLVMKQQGAHKVSMREALTWTVIWVTVAMIFNAWLWWYLGGTSGDPAQTAVANQKALEFLTGYLVEKSLAVDNIFVFLMIFTFFAVPLEFQKRALIIGVILAIVLRTIMILIGAWLLARFHWLLYVFGAFLVFTGIKMWWAAEQKPDLDQNPVLKFLRKHMKIRNEFDGEKLFTLHNGVKYATPMLLVIVMIGVTDVIFAVDSIPAIFAITEDPFIVLTSNIFAILGLRALYFVLAEMADRFHLLSYGLSIVLIFIGTKMLLIDVYKIPVMISLAVVACVIAISMIISLMRPPADKAA
jgi:tellurite resistance protein TerC